MEEKSYNLDFMYNKIAVKTVVMVELLKSEQFIAEIKKRVDNNMTINNYIVYEIVESIYFPKRLHRELTGKKYPDDKFNHSNARSALRQLGKKLYGD